MQRSRLIVHVDMDAFYASVEQRDNPELQGKPVIVGGAENRGVVAAASYEVRKFGVHSAMPVREALRRCPEAVCVRPRMQHYRRESNRIFSVFHEFTPIVEGLSLDEAFLDLSGSGRLFGNALDMGRKIKQRIRDHTGLTASVGLAPNKLVAKIASDLEKPDGLCLVTPDMLPRTLDPLPVRVLPGVGPKTGRRLNDRGIHTLAELRCAADSDLKPVFGRYAQRMRERAAGIDARAVASHVGDKSISHEETFATDINELEAMQSRLMAMMDKAAARLRRKNLVAGVVAVKIRSSDFSTLTRQRSFSPSTNDTRALQAMARELLSRWYQDHPGTAVRLLGAGVSGLTDENQLDLFASPADGVAHSGLDDAVDRIRERFGEQSVKRGSNLR